MSENVGVVSCGIITFGFVIDYDCPTIINVNSISLIGENPIKIARLKSQGIQIWIPKARYRYNSLCKSRLCIQVLIQKIHTSYCPCDQTLHNILFK